MIYIQYIPRHSPHITEHFRLYLKQVHIRLLQSVLQPHFIILRRLAGAGALYVYIGIIFPSLRYQPLYCPSILVLDDAP